MNAKLKRQILFETARLLHNRQETDTHRARMRAIRSLTRGWIHPADVPHPREVHNLIQQMESGGWPDPDRAITESQRFRVFESLMRPLEFLTGRRTRHPEGDLLYHSLQVFELVCDEMPYDEDLLVAALLHDVGCGIDPKKPVEAALNALSGLISVRTAWLIEHHKAAAGLLDGTIGARARRRLIGSEWFDELEVLARADRDGRVPGARVRELPDALDFIRNLGAEFDAD